MPGTRSNASAAPVDDSFDPKQYAQLTDAHTETLKLLEKRVGTNENFGKTFKATATDSKAIDDAVGTIVIQLLKDNSEAQEAVTAVVDKIDSRQMKKQLFGLGKIGLWILSIVATILITTWVTNIVNKSAEPSNQTSSTNNQKTN